MTVDEKLDLILESMNGFNSRLNDVENSINSLENSVNSVKDNLNKVENNLNRVEKSNNDIKLMLENETNKSIQLLAENHGNLIDKLNQAIKVSDKTTLYEIQVNILKNKVDKLEKDVAEIKNHIA